MVLLAIAGLVTRHCSAPGSPMVIGWKCKPGLPVLRTAESLWRQASAASSRTGYADGNAVCATGSPPCSAIFGQENVQEIRIAQWSHWRLGLASTAALPVRHAETSCNASYRICSGSQPVFGM